MLSGDVVSFLVCIVYCWNGMYGWFDGKKVFVDSFLVIGVIIFFD